MSIVTVIYGVEDPGGEKIKQRRLQSSNRQCTYKHEVTERNQVKQDSSHSFLSPGL